MCARPLTNVTTTGQRSSVRLLTRKKCRVTSEAASSRGTRVGSVARSLAVVGRTVAVPGSRRSARGSHPVSHHIVAARVSRPPCSTMPTLLPSKTHVGSDSLWTRLSVNRIEIVINSGIEAYRELRRRTAFSALRQVAAISSSHPLEWLRSRFRAFGRRRAVLAPGRRPLQRRMPPLAPRGPRRADHSARQGVADVVGCSQCERLRLPMCSGRLMVSCHPNACRTIAGWRGASSKPTPSTIVAKRLDGSVTRR